VPIATEPPPSRSVVRGRRLHAKAAPTASQRRDRRWGIFFISPAIAAFLPFWIIPFGLAVFYSMTDWRVGSDSQDFVGLENYQELVADPRFRQSIRATVTILVLSLSGVVVLATMAAIALSSDRLRGGRLFRLLLIAPVVTDWIATSLVWQMIYLPNQGVLASTFRQLEMDDLATLRWTTDRTLAPVAISIFIIWKTVGFYTIIVLAGIKSVPRDLTEAAAMDGATRFQTVRHITLPSMRPILLFVVLHSLVTIIALFEPVFMLTNGGPVDATRTLPLFIYEQFFQFNEGGYASAASIIFLLVTVAFALVMGFRLRGDLKESTR